MDDDDEERFDSYYEDRMCWYPCEHCGEEWEDEDEDED